MDFEHYVVLTLEHLTATQKEYSDELKEYREKISDKFEEFMKIQYELLPKISAFEHRIEMLETNLEEEQKKLVVLKDSLIKRLIWSGIIAAAVSGLFKLIELIASSGLKL